MSWRVLLQGEEHENHRVPNPECMGKVQRFLTRILAAFSESLVPCAVGNIMEEHRTTAKNKNFFSCPQKAYNSPDFQARTVSHVGQHVALNASVILLRMCLESRDCQYPNCLSCVRVLTDFETTVYLASRIIGLLTSGQSTLVVA